MMKVIVGMSGGVDSSVAAYLLKKEGYEVEGVSFVLEERRIQSEAPVSACCSLESLLDAKKTSDVLGIKHTMVSLRSEFADLVIGPFIEAYRRGLTPNPCILCNEHIKFTYLLKIADEKGADYIATGHYARIKHSSEFGVRSSEFGVRSSEFGVRSSELKDRGNLLMKGVDPKKDQSYVLYVLRREALDRLLLPLGTMRKEKVRSIAQELGLPSALRPESQEICFVGDGSYGAFLDDMADSESGPIIEIETGRVLGTHSGIHRYTIGQRKGLGIATGRPLFVVRIDPASKAVYVGQRELALKKEVAVDNINWLVETEVSELRATVKIRSMMQDEPASLRIISKSSVHVTFDDPQWAPAPGQSAVFYDSDVVLGGGVISAA
ncbi:MAG: tRNA 2-thiouridine(34) synthase MnmA [Nitrospirota bacterium]